MNALMPEFSDAPFGKEIHHCRQRDHDQSERRINERRDDGCNIDKNGDEIFPRHSLVQPLELGFVMITRDRFAQEKKRNGARRGDGGIKRDWKWQRVIVAEINRYPRDERDPKKQIDVCPKNDRIDPGHEVNEMMMIDPIDRNDDEAQDISEKVGHIRANEAGVGSCGAFNSKTMMVIRIAITPSLNASIRLVFMQDQKVDG